MSEDKKQRQRAASARYREKHAEKVKADRKAYYEKHREQELENHRKYKEANPEKVKALKAVDAAKQRVSKAQRFLPWLSNQQKQEIKDWYSAAQELSKIFPWKLHVDHIVPLRGATVSGLHVPWNLQLLPAQANYRKRNNWEISDEIA